MQFVTQLVAFAILTTPVLLWARLSKLDIGLSAPDIGKAEPWILLLILWSTAEWAIAIFLPPDVDPDWLTRMEQLSLGEILLLSVVLGPVFEELLFRGVIFAALLRRWGIWAATIVPSLIWALIHLQYEWWAVAFIIGAGVLLAMIRWKSGSLYLPVGLHAAHNLIVTLNDRGVFGSVA